MNQDSLMRNARSLRRNMTVEERKLWYQFLRDLPVHFRRQHVLGKYIVDFYCHSRKLVIELDGSQHYEDAGRAADTARDAWLRAMHTALASIDSDTMDDVHRQQFVDYIEMAANSMVNSPL